MLHDDAAFLLSSLPQSGSVEGGGGEGGGSPRSNSAWPHALSPELRRLTRLNHALSSASISNGSAGVSNSSQTYRAAPSAQSFNSWSVRRVVLVTFAASTAPTTMLKLPFVRLAKNSVIAFLMVPACSWSFLAADAAFWPSARLNFCDTFTSAPRAHRGSGEGGEGGEGGGLESLGGGDGAVLESSGGDSGGGAGGDGGDLESLGGGGVGGGIGDSRAARSTGSHCGGHVTGWLASTSFLTTLGGVMCGMNAA